ncbi:hypothetical protein KJI95_06095 [Shewanella sp. JM162201]|uniref:LysM domain-containing protein n=1 Tax=Shewanella jiangmenensis TaxID=2837387 RepID=A0ABS5V335_9GAMM|nr:FimV/HubP family polar landmark protein [Shewanella jiangmenensis]MBT1444094.1 hypothetical protein [Shewanella jiangmenensis]
MIRAFFVVLLLLGLALPAAARVSHVSINKSQFTLGEHPRLRVNVVSDKGDFSRIEFLIRQGKSEEKLMLEPVNNFLVLLTGVEDVTDASAELVVREYVINEWHDYKVIPLFGGNERLARAAQKPVKADKALASTARTAVPVSAQAASAVSSGQMTDSKAMPSAVKVAAVKPVAAKPDPATLAAINAAAVMPEPVELQRVKPVPVKPEPVKPEPVKSVAIKPAADKPEVADKLEVAAAVKQEVKQDVKPEPIAIAAVSAAAAAGTASTAESALADSSKTDALAESGKADSRAEPLTAASAKPGEPAPQFASSVNSAQEADVNAETASMGAATTAPVSTETVSTELGSTETASTEPVSTEPGRQAAGAAPTQATAQADADAQVAREASTQTQVAATQAIATQAVETEAPSAAGEGCRVEYKQGETLWRIASRYAPAWNTNVYGTMLALHDANPGAFRSGKISGMKQGAKFDCPSPAVLSRYPDAREARKQFEARQTE